MRASERRMLHTQQNAAAGATAKERKWWCTVACLIGLESARPAGLWLAPFKTAAWGAPRGGGAGPERCRTPAQCVDALVLF